jgi:hypothetical protein
MGTTLTGTTPQDTYDSLIKVTDNGPIGATAKLLSDGLGNDSSLALSTTFTSIRGGNQLRLFRTDNAIYGSIQYLTGAGGFKFDDANGDGYTFAQGADTRLAITSAGNVGIGTSSPLAKLDVRGTSYLTSTGTDGTLADAIILGNSGFPDTQSNRIRTTTSASAELNRISIEAGNGTAGQYINEQLMVTGNGYVRLGSGTGGLQFNGDTAAANALDDYEEGTFTPTVAFGGASVGITYLTQAAKYTKVGNKVSFSIVVTLSNKGSSTGSVSIAGLPFNVSPSTNADFIPITIGAFINITFSTVPACVAIVNTNTLILDEYISGGAQTPITDADFANDSTFRVAGFYFV